MGLWQNLKLMKAMATSGYDGNGPTEKALAAMTPEQQVAYRAALAQAEAAAGDVDELAAHRFDGRPLQGPAGEHLYRDTTGVASPEALAEMNAAQLLALESRRQKEMWGELRRHPLGGRDAPPPPPPPVAPDPGGRAAAELAARVAARAPYLAPERGAIRITRIPAKGALDADEVRAFLASSGLAGRPDLVFGAYRVPDHHTTSAMLGQKRTYVEWDVVHADVGGLPPAPEPEVATLEAGEHWVDRRIGEPSVLDEDLAVAYLASAGIGPDRTFGIARRMQVRSVDADETSGSTVAWVTGVHVLHAPVGPLGAALDRFAAARPVALSDDGVAGVHLEVLNWGAVADAVHPQPQKPAPVPSPFPYLPGTAQELLVAYLEVVGVHPAHCYGAAVVESGPRAIDGYGSAGPFTTKTNVGAEVMCADGERRRRLHAGRLVTITYLDTPTYVEGRERWAAYQRDALQARLEQETGARRPVQAPHLGGLPSGVRTAINVVGTVGDFLEGEHDPFADHPPHRYCWPPVG